MIVEVLFPEFYIYGEKENIRFLEETFPHATWIKSAFSQTPYFVEHDVDVIIMEGMAEYYLDWTCEKLLPFKDRLKELMDRGTYFLLLNNAMDIFGKSLKTNDGENLSCLGLLDYTCYRDYEDRLFYQMIWTMDGEEYIGSYNGFSRYKMDPTYHFYQIIKGIDHPEWIGGYHERNIYGMELISQIFICNPALTKRICRCFNQDDQLPLEKELEALHKSKIKAYKEDKRIMKKL